MDYGFLFSHEIGENNKKCCEINKNKINVLLQIGQNQHDISTRFMDWRSFTVI